MRSIEDMIIDAVDNRFKVLSDRLQFDKTYYGKVVSVAANKCVVEINQVNYNCRIRDGLNLTIDDVVLIKSPNNNFSFLYVDCKLL